MNGSLPITLRESLDSARLASEIRSLADRPLSIESALESVLRAVAQAAGFAVGQAWLPASGGSALECRVSWVAGPQFAEFAEVSRAIVFARDVGVPGLAWARRKPALMCDLSKTAGFYRSHAAAATGLRLALALPVMHAGEVVAVFEFLATDVATLSDALARDVAQALAPLGDFFAREREQAQRESEARSRSLFDSPMIGIVFWERGGRLLDANDAFLRMVGYNRDELETGLMSWQRLTPPEDRLDEWIFRQIEATGVCPPFERECQRKDGRSLTVLIGGSIAPGSGAAVCYVLDVSERRRVADALRESEERFRAFMDNSPAVAFMKNADGVHLYANAPWSRYFGLKSFSTLYGFTWTAYAIAGAVGPIVMGRAFDATG